MARLEGKVALISGGARGQGAVEARMFAEEGASVVIGDILDEQGRQTEAELQELGYNVTYVHLDVTSESDWESAVQAAVSTYGKLDILLNNAGILIRKNIEETTEEDWDRIFSVNAKGVFLGTKAAIPAMRENGGGSIINISSTAGLVGSPNGSASYTATKGAVRLFTKSTAIQHAREGDPLQLDPPGADRDGHDRGYAERSANMALRMQRLPLGRVGKPSEIAYGAIYLASDESSFVTGSEVVIDGGTTAA